MAWEWHEPSLSMRRRQSFKSVLIASFVTKLLLLHSFDLSLKCLGVAFYALDCSL